MSAANLITVWNGRELFWAVEESEQHIDIECLTPLSDEDRARATVDALAEWRALL